MEASSTLNTPDLWSGWLAAQNKDFGGSLWKGASVVRKVREKHEARETRSVQYVRGGEERCNSEFDSLMFFSGFEIHYFEILGLSLKCIDFCFWA